MATSKLIQPYLKHDNNANTDGKIMRLSLDFRKLAKSMSREDLENLAVLGAYGCFWRILEFMSNNKFMTSDLEMIADSLRINPEFVKKIMTEYELFRVEDEEFISDRLLRDLIRQEEKSQKASESATIRHLAAKFNEAYKEFFKEEPVLTNKEIESLKNYAKKIPDLKDKLRDIIYTLSTLKFEKADIKFVPCANWLLKDNNLARLYNGEFGNLKHKPTEKELKEKQRKEAEIEAERNRPSELEEICLACSGKAEALNIIKKYYEGKNPPCVHQNKILLLPTLKLLTERFDITNQEVLSLWQD